MSSFPPADNPYVAPQGYAGPPPSQRVQGPATGLMVVGGLGLAFGLLGIVLNLMGVGLGAAAGGEGAAENIAGGIGGLIGGVIGMAFNGLIFYGGMQMKNLQSHGLAFAASILAMLPCSCMCLIGIPIGIWSLQVLNDPNVKAAFR